MPGEGNKFQREGADGGAGPVTAVMPHLEQVALTGEGFVTLSVCDTVQHPWSALGCQRIVPAGADFS